jgi:hypothetical protein
VLQGRGVLYLCKTKAPHTYSHTYQNDIQ